MYSSSRLTFFLLTFLTYFIFAGEKKFVLDPSTRDYDQKHIKLELRIDFDKEKVMGVATMIISPLKDGFQRLILHSRSSKVFVVLVDGKTCEFDLENGLLKIQLNKEYKSGEELKAEIRYTSEPVTGLYFFHPTGKQPEIPYQVWSQGEDEDNRHWFPCYDKPDDKLTSEMIVTVPENMRVFSNGDLLKVTPNSANKEVTFHWKTDFEHSSYLISLVAGEYITYSDSVAGVALHYNIPQDAAGFNHNLSFGRTPAMMQFFGDYIAPYPYKRYDQNPVQDFRYGGMENTTATTLNKRLLHDECAQPNYSPDPLIAHELAHQWFGDLLTCKTWEHIWLNEGITSYFTDLFFEHHLGVDEFGKRRVEQNRRYVRAVNFQPIDSLQPGENGNTPVELSGGKAYSRGAAITHMIRYELGDSLFRKAMRSYVEKHRYQNVVSEDLRKVLEAVSGRSFKQFFKQWVYGAGYPKFKVRWEWIADSLKMHLYVDQIQETFPAMDLFYVTVPLEIRVGNQQIEKRLILHQRQQRFTFAMEKAPDMVLFDRGCWILKEVDFPKSFPELNYQLLYDLDVTGREWAAKQMADIGKQAVPALKTAFSREPFYWVRQRIVKSLEDIGGLEALAVITAAAHDPDARVRVDALEAMAKFDKADVQEILIDRMKNDPNDYARAAATASLGKVEAGNAFPKIVKMLEIDSHRNIIRRSVFKAAAEIKDPAIFPFIIKYTQYKYSHGGMHLLDSEALNCAETLAENYRDKAVEAIASALENPYFRTRNKAAHLLAKLDAKEKLANLKHILKTERRESVRSVLEKAVDRLTMEGSD